MRVDLEKFLELIKKVEDVGQYWFSKEAREVKKAGGQFHYSAAPDDWQETKEWEEYQEFLKNNVSSLAEELRAAREAIAAASDEAITWNEELCNSEEFDQMIAARDRLTNALEAYRKVTE